MGNFFSTKEDSESHGLKSGHTVVPLSDEESEKIVKDFPPMAYGGIRLQPGGWLLYKSFPKFANRIYNFEFRESDVLIMTFPKCGTTWTQEIVWTMQHNMKFKHPEAHLSVMLRSPFIDSDFFLHVPIDIPFFNPFTWYFLKKCPGRNPFKGAMLLLSEKAPNPRSFKTHIALSLYPPDLLEKCKVIYVARNPLDACISYYHHNKLMLGHGYIGTWEDFVEYFINDLTIYSPYWEHLKEAWQKRNHPNLLFCFYEEMKKEPRENIKKINDFIGRGLTEEEIDKLLDYTSFSAMKNRDSALGSPDEASFFFKKEIYEKDGGFFRKGESGDWKTKFNIEQKEKMAKWIRTNLENGFDEDFPYWKILSEL